jgi:hypothetical protein
VHAFTRPRLWGHVARTESEFLSLVKSAVLGIRLGLNIPRHVGFFVQLLHSYVTNATFIVGLLILEGIIPFAVELTHLFCSCSEHNLHRAYFLKRDAVNLSARLCLSFPVKTHIGMGQVRVWIANV